MRNNLLNMAELPELKDSSEPNPVPPSQSAQMDSLSVVCSRLSHAIRTPLSVALGVLEDLVKGYDLTQRDYEDARLALKQIQGLLELVRDFSHNPTLNSGELTLNDIIAKNKDSNFGISSEPPIDINFSTPPSNQIEDKVDETHITRALRSVIKYLQSPHSIEQNNVGVKINYRASRTTHCWEMDNSSNIPSKSTLMRPITWRSLCDIDHRPDTLPLIYAELVFTCSGFRTEAIQQPDSTFVFRIVKEISCINSRP